MKYQPHEIKAVIATAKEKGMRQAAKEHGVAGSTIYTWLKKTKRSKTEESRDRTTGSGALHDKVEAMARALDEANKEIVRLRAFVDMLLHSGGPHD